MLFYKYIVLNGVIIIILYMLYFYFLTLGENRDSILIKIHKL